MKRLRKAAYAVSFVLLSLFVFAVSHSYYERWQATRLLSILQQIRVGTTTQQTVMEMTSPFRSHREEYVHEIRPELEFLYVNRWAAMLKLATPTEFRAHVTFKDGVVVSKDAREMVNASGCVGRIRESKRVFRYSDGAEPTDRPNHYVVWEDHWPQIAPGKVRRILIENDDTYPEAQRRDDWVFDLSCLTRLGTGCWDARTILPNAVKTPHSWDSRTQ